jgi:hypothetical protein
MTLVLGGSYKFPKFQFYPIWFAQSSTFMYINWKGRLLGTTFVSILQLGVQRGASIGEFQKNCCWAHEYAFKQKKSYEHTTHELN